MNLDTVNVVQGIHNGLKSRPRVKLYLRVLHVCIAIFDAECIDAWLNSWSRV